MRYPVVLFDLFRTVVRFTPNAPTGQVKETTWRPAMNALRRLDAVPSDALMVGDSLPDDVGGAAAAGIDSAWVNWDGIPPPAEAPQPTYTLRALVDLRRVLEGP